MKILIIAPLKAPYTGNALPIKLIFDYYKEFHQITLVNLNKKSFKAGIDSLKRIFEIIRIFFLVSIKCSKKDIIYLTIAESFSGNLRDIIIYILTYSKRKKTIIHMLGGAAMKSILDEKNGMIFKVNRFFISRLGAVIVEGKAQADFFSNVISPDRIFIVPNFAQEYLFTNELEIEEKFSNTKVFKVLFLSNMILGKGHQELISAFLQLNANDKQKFQLDFAGSFENEEEKEIFVQKIAPFNQVRYHGHVSGNEKIELFKNAHIFILPTYYPYEGQPFVIIEAYAGGCFVITTNHSGIGYIFSDKINGMLVEKKSVDSIVNAFKSIIKKNDDLLIIGKSNYKYALMNYTESNYIKGIEHVINSLS